MEDKKPFKESKFYKFLTEKVAPVAGDVTSIAGKVVTGNWGQAIQEVGDMLQSKSKDDTAAAQLSAELESQKMEMVIELQKLDYQFFQQEIADKSDARATEIARYNAGQKNLVQNALAFIGVLAFFILTAYMVVYGIAEVSKEAMYVIGSLTGIVGSNAISIFQYYFGSSRGSRAKDDAFVRAFKSNGK
jgi:hypothetical protein